MVIALLALVWAPKAYADAPCDRAGLSLILDVDPTSRPFSRVAGEPSLTDGCRQWLMNELAVQFEATLELGMCQGKPCQDMKTAARAVRLLVDAQGDYCRPRQCGADGSCESCRLRDDALSIVSQADDALAAAVGPEADAALSKIDAGWVPTCLLPEGCPGPGCRAALARSWWGDTWTKQSGDQFVLSSGGLAHLALADTFTCDAGRQKGGTCAIYSGVNLMNHYCATPFYNPAAARTCGTPAGAGFRCPSPEEFLRAAYEEGAWTAATCSEDGGTASSRCAPIEESPMEKDEQKLLAQVSEACQDGRAPTPRCIGLLANLDALRRRAGGRPGAWVGGGYGVNFSKNLEPFKRAYRRFGFDVVYYPATDAGFGAALAALAQGHPAQLLLQPGDWWAGYGNSSESHAVVMEGVWDDPDGVKWVLLRDSNNPGAVSGFKEAVIRAKVLGLGGGLLGVCPPNASGPCSRP